MREAHAHPRASLRPLLALPQPLCGSPALHWAQVLSKGGGGGGGTSGSGGRGGGGGGPKNAYSSGSTMSGSTKAGGRWSAGGATTPGGSSVVNYNGRAMSTVPRYYRFAVARARVPTHTFTRPCARAYTRTHV